MMLDKLWALIGDGGCRLTTAENAQIIQFLSVGEWTSKSSYSIAEAFERFDEDYQLLDFNGCTVPINDYEDFTQPLIFLSPQRKRGRQSEPLPSMNSASLRDCISSTH